MKKPTSKLVLRKEFLRELSKQVLSHVIGGQETDVAYPQSGLKQCGSGLVATLDVPGDGDKE